MKNVHQKVIPECKGCNKIDGDICIAYLNPTERHRLCECPLKTDKNIQVTSDGKLVKKKRRRKKR